MEKKIFEIFHSVILLFFMICVCTLKPSAQVRNIILTIFDDKYLVVAYYGRFKFVSEKKNTRRGVIADSFCFSLVLDILDNIYEIN